MTYMPSRSPSFFDIPADYRISVQGRVNPTWADRLEGMTIRQTAVDASRTVTTLQGELKDQSALAGVLNTLYELHLSLLSVERLANRLSEESK
jgi:hypothetical protein